MKRLFTAVALIMFLFPLFTGCELFTPSKDATSVEAAKTGDFTVALRSITLNADTIGTVVGGNVSLQATLSPPSATKKTLVWSTRPVISEGITINPNTGVITVTSDDITDPILTVVKVQAEADAAIYAECKVTVYPNNYPTTRTWSFDEHPTGGGTNSNIVAPPSGEYDYGDGMWLMMGTGGGRDYIEDKPGLYIIDPEDPYKVGLTPSGAAIGGNYNWGDTNWPSGGSATNLPNWSQGHIRVGGIGRALKVAALQGPFTIVVNYISNGGDTRTTNLRIGETEGFLVMGEGSPSSNQAGAKTVYYCYTGTEIIPLVFVEVSAGMRIYDVKVLGSDASAKDKEPYPERTTEINGVEYTY